MRKQKPPRPKAKAVAKPAPQAPVKGGAPVKALLKQAADKKQPVLINILNGTAPLLPELRKQPLLEIQLAETPAPNQVAGSLTRLSAIPDDCAEVVWNSGALAYCFTHEIPGILSELHRIVKPTGRLILQLPDLQRVAEAVAEGKIDQVLYRSPAGPIHALDMIYGHSTSIAQGHRDRISHTGFTATSIGRLLGQAGFGEIDIWRQGWILTVKALKVKAVPANKPAIRQHDDDINTMMTKRDTIMKEPEIWTPVKL